MPIDEERIYRDLESIRAMLDSLAKSVSGNIAQNERRFATLETQYSQVDENYKLIGSRLESLRDSVLGEINPMRGDVRELREWKRGFEQSVDTRTLFVDGQIKELATWQGRADAKFIEISDAASQIKGAKKVWVGVGSVLGFFLVVVNIWHIWGGGH